MSDFNSLTNFSFRSSFSSFCISLCFPHIFLGLILSLLILFTTSSLLGFVSDFKKREDMASSLPIQETKITIPQWCTLQRSRRRSGGEAPYLCSRSRSPNKVRDAVMDRARMHSKVLALHHIPHPLPDRPLPCPIIGGSRIRGR